MKWIRIVFVIVSVILLAIILYAIINCEISYKYEIEGQHTEKMDLMWTGVWLKETISVLKFFLYYVIANIIYLLTSIIIHYRRKHDNTTRF